MKKSKRLLILLTIFTTIFSVRNVNAAPTIIADKMKEQITTSGEGLYLESYSGDYYFKGTDPDNYIEFNGDLWRVMSVRKDGTVRIIKATALDGIPYDIPFLNRESSYNAPSLADTRYSNNTADYCYSNLYWVHYYGCKIWGSKTTLFDKNKNPITQLVHDKGDIRNLPDKDATLNTYLNGEYYNSISKKDQDKIIESWFDVGPYSFNFDDITKDFEQVEAVKWRGKIGIIAITDYARTTTNSACENVLSYGMEPNCVADPQTYIFDTFGDNDMLFTLTPFYDSSYRDNHYAIVAISDSGEIGDHYPSYYDGVVPVLTLRSDLLIVDGNGKEQTPFKFEAEFSVTTKVENGNGTVSPGKILKDGESFEIIFAPYNGYTIDKVLLNGTDVTSSVVDNKLVINSVDSDKEIVVTFKKIKSATNNNPATGDNVLGSIMLLLASITMIVGIRVFSKRLNSNKE